MSKRFLAYLLIAATFLPASASAGRRPFLLAYDAEIVPEGDVELEEWIWAESKFVSGRPVAYWLWLSPVIGVSNHLELSLPLQFSAGSNSTSLESIFAEVRYRIFSREKDSGFQPVVRLAYRQAVVARLAPSRIEVNVVGSYGKISELHFTVDLGASIAGPWPEASNRPIFATYSAGVSYPLLGNELQVALEGYGRLGIQDTSATAFPRHSLGGALAWSRGRTWITAGCLFGLTKWAPATPRYLPRLNWGIAF